MCVAKLDQVVQNNLLPVATFVGSGGGGGGGGTRTGGADGTLLSR